MKKLIVPLLLLLTSQAFATPLIDAVNIGDRATVISLLEGGVDPNQPDQNGDGPLLQAISGGQSEIAGDLIEHGASLDVRDGEKQENLLFETVRLGQNGLLRKILARAPHLVNDLNTDGESALFAAVRSSQTLSAKLLIRAGATKDLRNKAGQVPADLIDPSDIRLRNLFAKKPANEKAASNEAAR